MERGGYQTLPGCVNPRTCGFLSLGVVRVGVFLARERAFSSRASTRPRLYPALPSDA